MQKVEIPVNVFESKETPRNIKFPALSFCPGFKDNMTVDGKHSGLYYSPFLQTVFYKESFRESSLM